MRLATSASSPRWNAHASARPATPPRLPSSRLSVTSWRISRPRLAPSAARKPSSRCAHRAARQQQVGDVHAGDEQHERDGAGEHAKRRADLVHHLFVHGHERDRPAGIAFAGTPVSSAAAMFFMSPSACSNETPSRRRASPCDAPRPGAARSRAIVQPYGIMKSARWPIDREARRHHADDGSRSAVGGDGRAEHVGARAQSRRPEFVAEDDDARRCLLRPRRWCRRAPAPAARRGS